MWQKNTKTNNFVTLLALPALLLFAINLIKKGECKQRDSYLQQRRIHFWSEIANEIRPEPELSGQVSKQEFMEALKSGYFYVSTLYVYTSHRYTFRKWFQTNSLSRKQQLLNGQRRYKRALVPGVMIYNYCLSLLALIHSLLFRYQVLSVE